MEITYTKNVDYLMNACKAQAEEIILAELVYS